MKRKGIFWYMEIGYVLQWYCNKCWNKFEALEGSTPPTPPTRGLRRLSNIYEDSFMNKTKIKNKIK